MAGSTLPCLQVLLIFGAGTFWWKWPVAELPNGLAWPLGPSLAAPHWGLFSASGFVAAAPWVLLCSRVTRLWLQVIQEVLAFPSFCSRFYQSGM